jgi:hypothetical protein
MKSDTSHGAVDTVANAVSLLTMAVVGSSRDRRAHLRPRSLLGMYCNRPGRSLPAAGAQCTECVTNASSGCVDCSHLGTECMVDSVWKHVSPCIALCAIIGVLLLALTTTLYVAQSDMTAAAMLVPLLIWLCFATYLSLQIHTGRSGDTQLRHSPKAML